MELPAQIVEAVLAHARFVHPYEACGLLAMDSEGRVRMVYCLTNIDESPSSFTVDPIEHFHALRHAERLGWHLGGVFHSHVGGPPVPSPRDVEAGIDPSWIHLIAGNGEVRGYRIREGSVSEEPLEVRP